MRKKPCVVEGFRGERPGRVALAHHRPLHPDLAVLAGGRHDPSARTTADLGPGTGAPSVEISCSSVSPWAPCVIIGTSVIP